MQIRPMTAKDLDVVLSIAAGLKDAPHWQRAAYENAIQTEVGPPRIALVAETEDLRIAGFLVAVPIPPEAELESIAVAAEFQRQGTGGKLMRRLIEEASTRNCSQILLEVRPSNRAGLAFYKALGFAESARRLAYYINPAEDGILMQLDLG